MHRGSLLPQAARVGWLSVALAVCVLIRTPSTADQETPWVPTEARGVVVEEVGKGAALEKAGLRPGDVVLAWERLPAPPANPERVQGTIESVFDWMWLEVEQAPRGTLRLYGERAGEKRLFVVKIGSWDGVMRPFLHSQALEQYKQGQAKLKTGEIDQGVELLSQLTEFEEAAVDSQLRAWVESRIGEEHLEAGDFRRAIEAYSAALEDGLDLVAKVTIWLRIGRIYERFGRLDEAEATFRTALEIVEATCDWSLHTATIRNGLGIVASYRGQFEIAATHFRDALKTREEQAPESLELASSLNNLGLVARAQGQLELASEFYLRSLEIRQELAPNSLHVAASLNNLGNLARARGQLEEAQRYLQRALVIEEELAPGSLDWAGNLNNLGNVASSRGQLELAIEYYQRSLEVKQRLVPKSLAVALGLGNLGNLARLRGQMELAREYYLRALEIREGLAPQSLEFAGNLNNLGVVESHFGHFEKARQYHQRALEIRKEVLPQSLELATSMDNLGSVALQQAQLELASEYFQSALQIRQTLAPESLDFAASMTNLGSLAQARSQLEEATQHYQHALQILERIGPESLESAEVLNELGRVSRARGQLGQAIDFFRRAILAFEAQRANLGASHKVQAKFRAQHGDYYRNSIDTLIQGHRPEEAFATLEGSRAKAFLALLTERDLIFSEVPQDLDRQRRSLAFRYEQTQRQLGSLNPRDHDEQIAKLTSQLRELRRQQDENTESIRRKSPNFAALRYPEPLDLEEVRQVLDPGTVMLCYSVAEAETHLFVLTRQGGLQVEALPLGREELRGEVENVLRLQRRRSAPSLYMRPLHQAGERLYRSLIQPVEGSIASSERILIIPDGPLHILPFALLVRKTDAGKGQGTRDFEYLVEWKPLHSALSGTVYAEIIKRRRNPLDKSADTLELAAFGDPHYSSPEKSQADRNTNRRVDVYIRAAAERGFDFRPLPYSREEVNRITALYPERTARAFLGTEASEERAKVVGKNARILHFATHGHFDDLFPLNSYLALTIPSEFPQGRDNGLLQAWEIFESVRLDADLVVLSACQSGLGEEIDGEGLNGLIRAFQFAGARTVAATLWKVEDRATAELMARFYGHLKAGMAKDEALRAAQLELIQGPLKVQDPQGRVEEYDFSAPAYWAAFQLIGDWL